ncbi:MAG: hypothetical protein H0V68_01245 [Actinobacteria bacterium]|nr:hypothetical protein [Actinomycetota bacterium]
MSGPRSSRHLVAFVAALALAASAFGGLVLPRLADADLPASMKTPAVKASPVRQKLDDGLCQDRHLRRLRSHRPDGAAVPGV